MYPTLLPPGVSPQWHAGNCQMIEGALNQLQAHPVVRQALMNSLATNPQVINSFYTFLFQSAAARGVDLRIPGANLHLSDAQAIIMRWTADAKVSTEVALQQQQQQQQPQPGTTNFGYNTSVGTPMSNNSMYSAGNQMAPTGGMPQQQPVPAAPPPQQTQPAQPMPSPSPYSQQEIPPVTEPLNWSRDADSVVSLSKSSGLEILGTPVTASWNNNRVVLTTLKAHQVEESAFSAYYALEHQLPEEMKRGYWTHRLIYTELGHLKLDTAKFIDIRTAVRKRYDAEKWRGVLAVLRDESQGVWDTINQYLVARLNAVFLQKIRIESDLKATIQIDTLKDLDGLCDPHFRHVLSDHPAFPSVLETIIHKAMTETFVHDSVSLPERNSVAPLMKCRAVEYFQDGTTKFDYGMLEKPDQIELLSKLYAENTVLLLPRCLGATNSIPENECLRLLNENHVARPENLGVFAKVFEHIAEDQKPRPDAMVLNRYKTPPANWLNIVRPVYPMGTTKAIYLDGLDKLIGW